MSQVRYHRVPEIFWALAREHNWPDKTVILGLYVQTCKHRTTEGLYSLPFPYVTGDLEWKTPIIEKAMGQLGKADFIRYDSRAEILLLPSALEMQAPKAPGQIEGAIRRLKYLPASPLIHDLYGYASTHASAFAEAMRVAFPAVTRVGTPSDYSNGKPDTHSSPLTRTLSTNTEA